MENFYPHFISTLESLLKEFSRELTGVKSIYLLDNDGFNIFSLYGREKEEIILHSLVNLLKNEFSHFNLLEIDDSSSRLCLIKVPRSNCYIAVFTARNITAGLVRVKLKKISSQITELLSSFESSIEEERINIEDLEKFLDFLSTKSNR